MLLNFFFTSFMLQKNTNRIDQQLGAEETNTSKNFDGLHQKTNVKDWLGQFYVSKMSRTFWDVSSTCLTPGRPIYGALAGVHESPKLWPTTFCDFGVPDPSISNWHAPLWCKLYIFFNRCLMSNKKKSRADRSFTINKMKINFKLFSG